jgi:cell filamentation protein
MISTTENHHFDFSSSHTARTSLSSKKSNLDEFGTVKGLQQLHGYLFGGLYDFAG